MEIPRPPQTCLSKQVATSLAYLIFLGRCEEGWYLFLRVINKANEEGRRFGRGRQVAGKGNGEKGTKIASIFFSSQILYSTAELLKWL